MDIQPYTIQMFWVMPSSSWVELNWVGYGYYPNCSGRVWILSKPDPYKKKTLNLSHCYSHYLSLPLLSHHHHSFSLSSPVSSFPHRHFVALSLLTTFALLVSCFGKVLSLTYVHIYYFWHRFICALDSHSLFSANLLGLSTTLSLGK